MKKRLPGSLTVEAVLLFPVIFLLFIAMLQCGLHLTYNIWGRSLGDQGVLLYQESMQNGEEPYQARERVREYLERKLKRAGLKEINVTVTEKNMLLYREITIKTEAQYPFFYKAKITNTVTGDYRTPRKVRDVMEVITEAVKRITGFSEKINQYKETIESWIEWIK